MRWSSIPSDLSRRLRTLVLLIVVIRTFVSSLNILFYLPLTTASSSFALYFDLKLSFVLCSAFSIALRLFSTKIAVLQESIPVQALAEDAAQVMQASQMHLYTKEHLPIWGVAKGTALALQYKSSNDNVEPRSAPKSYRRSDPRRRRGECRSASRQNQILNLFWEC